MTKLEKLKNNLPDDVYGVIVTDVINIRYLTGFNYTDGFVLVTKDKSYCVTDFRYIEAAREECSKEFNIEFDIPNKYDFIKSIIPANSKVMLEDRTLDAHSYNEYVKNLDGIEIIPCDTILIDTREYKEDDEIEKITKAQRIAEKAFDHILGFITPDKTEIEVALELEFYMRKLGAERVAFDTICVSGSASSKPHGVPRHCKLESGFLTMDYGAVFDGYLSDMTRTVCLGKPTEDMKKMYATVLESQLKALDNIQYGMKLFDCDKLSRDVIDATEYKGCFGHGLGHGVGMEIHESPYLNKRQKEKTLENGHVVTVEPGIYVEKKYGVRIEDMIVCRNNKTELITNCPKELIII